MTSLNRINEQKLFIVHLYKTYQLYLNHGSRSSKKVNYFHQFIKRQLNNIFTYENGYRIELEKNMPSTNSSGFKKCDIVIYKHDNPYIIIPVKLIMSNYKQNKNNSWENLTGELSHLKWANNNIHLIPMNIYTNITPYLLEGGKIKRFETISIKDIEQYKILTEKNITHDAMNYIMDIEHDWIIDSYLTLPVFLHFNKHTKYRTFHDVFCDLI